MEATSQSATDLLSSDTTISSETLTNVTPCTSVISPIAQNNQNASVITNGSADYESEPESYRQLRGRKIKNNVISSVKSDTILTRSKRKLNETASKSASSRSSSRSENKENPSQKSSLSSEKEFKRARIQKPNQVLRDISNTVSNNNHSVLENQSITSISNNSSRLNYQDNDSMTLKLTCDTDDSYDVNNANFLSPSSPTLNEAAENLMYFSATPTLLNQKLTGENLFFQHNVNIPLNTPTQEQVHKLVFNYNVGSQDENNNDLIPNELGWFVCKEKSIQTQLPKPEQNQNISQFQITDKSAEVASKNINKIENEISSEDDDSDDDESSNERTPKRYESIYYKNINLTEIDKEPNEPKLTDVSYSMKVAKVLFTTEELAKGIFVGADNKNRSKLRVPLDSHRIDILKEALAVKFGYNSHEVEAVWKTIRAEINKKLNSIKLK